MQNNSAREVGLVIFTAVVGIASVWISLQLFGRSSEYSPHIKENPPIREEHMSPQEELKNLRKQLTELKNQQLPSPSPTTTTEDDRAVHKELEDLRKQLIELKNQQLPSPSSTTTTEDDRAVHKELEDLRKQLAVLQNQKPSTSEEKKETTQTIEEKEKRSTNPQPSTPGEDPQIVTAIHAALQKAEELSKNETNTSWTEEQESILKELYRLYAIKNLKQEQNGSLLNSIRELGRKKIDLISRQALQLDTQQGLELIEEARKSTKGLKSEDFKLMDAIQQDLQRRKKK